MNQSMFIAVDFDGTCVTHEYPDIGKNIGAVDVLKKLAKKHKLILWTMRSNQELKDAVHWFKYNEIPLYGIQENPSQHTWTNSPKAYAHLYIDDAGINCPLIYDTQISDRPFVDWVAVEKYLTSMHII